MSEAYPGQAFFHAHNPRIKRAEENFDIDKAFEFLEMPTIPQNFLDFNAKVEKMAQELCYAPQNYSSGIDASTELLP